MRGAIAVAELIPIGVIALYGVMAAWLTSRTYLRRSDKIGTVRPGYTYLTFSQGGVLAFATVVGVLWPVGMFLLLALNLIDHGERRIKAREAELTERERILDLGMAELKREGLA